MVSIFIFFYYLFLLKLKCVSKSPSRNDKINNTVPNYVDIHIFFYYNFFSFKIKVHLQKYSDNNDKKCYSHLYRYIHIHIFTLLLSSFKIQVRFKIISSSDEHYWSNNEIEGWKLSSVKTFHKFRKVIWRAFAMWHRVLKNEKFNSISYSFSRSISRINQSFCRQSLVASWYFGYQRNRGNGMRIGMQVGFFQSLHAELSRVESREGKSPVSQINPHPPLSPI